MFKFLRKYQKLMLAVFCVGLMVAFLVPQAAQQFAPNPAEDVMGTAYDGREIRRSDVQRALSDLQMMRRLRFDPLALPGLTLLPNTDSDTEDALQWLLIQHAADHNRLGASQQESFNLAASLLGVETMEELETKAKEAQLNAPYLMDLATQYLKAEQYRQLVMGVQYAAPGEDEGATGSPGLRRIFAINDTLEAAREIAQQYTQMGLPANQAEGLALQSVMLQGGGLDKIIGHERVTSNQIRYALQQEYTALDLSVAVLNADDKADGISVDDAYVQGIFERYAADAPGTGAPYGLGYREPHKVKLEAIRVPIDAVRQKVASEISSEDIRAFYNERPSEYIDAEAAEGETPAAPRLTPAMRDEIRVTLTAMRSEQKCVEIAQQIRARLNEDGRGLESQGTYRVLPEGFTPTPLVVVAEQIKQEFGIECEVIQIDQPVSAQEIEDSMRFTQAWIGTLPTSTVRVPHAQFTNILVERQLPEVTLGGKAGLFASIAPELSNVAAGQALPLAVYVRTAQPFVAPDSQEATLGLQVGLPGRILIDVTRSTYVFRLADAIPSHPAPELAPIAEKVKEDAKRVKAYETLVQQKDALLAQAAAQPFEELMKQAADKQTLSGVLRQSLRQPRSQPIQGVTNAGKILQQAFGTADQVMASGGFESAAEKDRVFAVEMPGDYRLALVRVDGYKSMTRKAFQDRAADPSALIVAASVGAKPYDQPPLSTQALMRYTGFKWGEGFSDATLGSDDESAEPTDADDEDDTDEPEAQ